MITLEDLKKALPNYEVNQDSESYIITRVEDGNIVGIKIGFEGGWKDKIDIVSLARFIQRAFDGDKECARLAGNPK